MDPRRLGAIALALPLLACLPQASSPSGAALYKRHCASCHGVSGHGDGPAAAALNPPPNDLTRYRASVQELMQVIDGRRAVRAHGTSAMPVWGEVFEQVHLDDTYAKRLALLQVQALADYVEHLAAGDDRRPVR
jgi:mono/diheme cytochrome c family protein